MAEIGGIWCGIIWGVTEKNRHPDASIIDTVFEGTIKRGVASPQQIAQAFFNFYIADMKAPSGAPDLEQIRQYDEDWCLFDASKSDKPDLPIANLIVDVKDRGLGETEEQTNAIILVLEKLARLKPKDEKALVKFNDWHRFVRNIREKLSDRKDVQDVFESLMQALGEELCRKPWEEQEMKESYHVEELDEEDAELLNGYLLAVRGNLVQALQTPCVDEN